MYLLLLFIILILWVTLKEKEDEVNRTRFPQIQQFKDEMKAKREALREKKRLEKLGKFDSSAFSDEDKYVVEANKNLEKLKEKLKQAPPIQAQEIKTHTKEIPYYLNGIPHKWDGKAFIPLSGDDTSN